MKRRMVVGAIFTLIFALASMAEELDNAIVEMGDYLNRMLTKGDKIAFVNAGQEFPLMVRYIIDGLIDKAVNDRLFSVVDRAQLDVIRSEQQFQASGDVDDATMQAMGRIFGVKTIITVKVTQIGDMFQFSVRALDVENARIPAAKSSPRISGGPLIWELTGTQPTQATPAPSAVPVQASQFASPPASASKSAQQPDGGAFGSAAGIFRFGVKGEIGLAGGSKIGANVFDGAYAHFYSPEGGGGIAGIVFGGGLTLNIFFTEMVGIQAEICYRGLFASVSTPQYLYHGADTIEASLHDHSASIPILLRISMFEIGAQYGYSLDAGAKVTSRASSSVNINERHSDFRAESDLGLIIGFNTLGSSSPAFIGFRLLIPVTHLDKNKAMTNPIAFSLISGVSFSAFKSKRSSL